MRTYGIVGAMDIEVDTVISRMTEMDVKEIARRQFYTGKLDEHNVVVVKSGIGKVAAATTVQLLIDHFPIDAIINTGMAGGLDPRLQVKDLVVSTGAVQHDFDLTPFGHALGYMDGPDDQKPTVFPINEGLLAAAREVAMQFLPEGNNTLTGIIASGDVFVDSTERKEHIVHHFSPIATEMEGAAIAQVARDNRMPCLILRVVSDLAEHQANLSFLDLEAYCGRLVGDLIPAIIRCAEKHEL